MPKAESVLKQLNRKFSTKKPLELFVDALIERDILDLSGLTFEIVKGNKEDFFTFLSHVYSSSTDEQTEAIEMSYSFCRNTKIKSKSGVNDFAEEIENAVLYYLEHEDEKEREKGRILEKLVEAISGDDIEIAIEMSEDEVSPEDKTQTTGNEVNNLKEALKTWRSTQSKVFNSTLLK